VLRATDRPTSDLQTVSCVYEESSSCDETYFVRKVEEQRGMRSCYVHESEQQATLGLTGIFFSGLPSPHHCFPGRYPAFAARMQRHDARLLLTGSGGDHIFWSGSDGAPLISDQLCRGRLHAAHQACAVWAGATGIPYLQLLGRSLHLALSGRPDPAPALPPWLLRRQREQVRSLLGDCTPTNRRGALPSARVKQQLVHSLFATTAAGYLNEYRELYVTHPYTHRPLVEFCLAVPVTQLVRGGQSRSLMRRALRGTLPDTIVRRQTKGALDECVARALQREW
jgi:asparagine synthetase B (glutamine-hydrolysing)